MTKGIIKNVTGNGSWEGKYGVMYSFLVEFEDGVSIEANSKSQLAPYGLNDTVWYEVVRETEYGKKGKISRTDPDQNFQKGSSGGGSQSPDIQKRIDACWSIGQAITILGSVPDEVSVAKWLEDVSDVSDMLIVLRDKKL